MKFIAKKGTATYERITAIRQRMDEAHKAANALRKSQKWGKWVLTPGGHVAGGIVGVQFSESPKDWRHVCTEDAGRFYYPIRGRKSTRQALAKLEALPVVSNKDWNGVIGSERFFGRFGMTEGKNCYLLNIPEGMKFDAPDLVEITTGEYTRLKLESSPSKADATV